MASLDKASWSQKQGKKGVLCCNVWVIRQCGSALPVIVLEMPAATLSRQVPGTDGRKMECPGATRKAKEYVNKAYEKANP